MASSEELNLDFKRPDDTSDASPIFGTVMVLWFLASGIGAGYFAVTRYIGGWPLLSMQVLGFAGAMVVGVLVAGAMVKMITWRSPTVPEEAPWELRPAWRSPAIEEDLYFRTVPPWSATLFGVAGWGVGGFILYDYWASANPDAEVLVFLIFPIAFSVPAVLTLRRIWHRRKYGTSTLVMDTMPARPGQTLEARLQTSVAPSDAPGDALQVQLTCYHRTSGGDDTSPSWLQEWQSETTVTEYFSSGSQSGTAADDSVEVPISFDLPDDAPPSTLEKKSNRIAWILEVSAETSGLDYQSYFEIPVFEPDAAMSQPSSPDPASSDEQVSSEEPTAPHEPSVEPTHSDRPSPSRDTDREQGVPTSDFSSGESSTDSVRDDEEDRTTDDRADEETVRCDNCYSTVEASASVCPACGADLESGWFS